MKPQLLIFNYAVINKAQGVLDVHIDGDIVDSPTQEMYRNFWGDETSVSFRSFRNQIEQANPSEVNCYVNTTGGHVGDAMAMHDYLVELENKGVKVNRIGRGIVASAGTYLVCGKNSSMTANSMMMIHNISLMVYGSITECENQVKAGRKYNDLIRDFYVNKTGQTAAKVSNWMDAETWFNAEEAKANGFVENVSEETSFSNSIRPEQWPFQNKAILNTYNSFTKNNTDMDIKKMTDLVEAAFNGLAKKLGIENKVAEEGSKAAITEFATALTNGIKAEMPVVPTNEAIQKMVNEAIAEATKDDAEVIKNAITEGTKGFINKTELDTQVNTLKTEIIKSIGNASTGDKNEKEKNASRPKNRFSGVNFFSES